MTWAAVCRFLKSWPGGVVVGAVGALVAVAILSARPSAAPGPTPYTAEPTRRAAEADKVTEALDVQTLKPEPKVRERIAREYRQPGIVTPDHAPTPVLEHGEDEFLWTSRPFDAPLSDDWAKEILTEVKFEPAPAGGTALTTVDRATGLVETIVRPLPEPRISFANRWRAVGSYGQFEDGEPLIRAQVEWWPVKVRRLELGAAAGWERTDRGRAYVLAQVAVVPR